MVILVIFERITFHIPKFTAPSQAKECMCDPKCALIQGQTQGRTKKQWHMVGEGSDFSHGVVTCIYIHIPDQTNHFEVHSSVVSSLINRYTSGLVKLYISQRGGQSRT